MKKNSWTAVCLCILLAGFQLTGSGCKREKHMDKNPVPTRTRAERIDRPSHPVVHKPVVQKPVKPVETVAVEAEDSQVHVVQPGDSLWKIGRKFGIPTSVLAEYNQLDRDAHLRTGQTLLIPDADDLATSATPPAQTQIEKPATSGTSSSSTGTTRLDWPHKGEILRRYDGQFKGIDLAASTTDFVTASEKGEVIYADPMEGYGKLVIVDHLNGLFTIYGQLRTILVSNGATVSRGQRVGRGGTEDERGRVRVYFEVRKAPRDGEDPVPVDPSRYLK